MTQMDVADTGAPQFSIGQVLSTGFSVLMRNIVPFFAVAIIVGIPYILVSSWSAAEAVPGQPNYGAQAITMLVSLLTMSLTTAGPEVLAPMQSTLASLWRRASRAVVTSWQSEARMPGILLAAIDTPMPLPHSTIPRSAALEATRFATLAAKSG